MVIFNELKFNCDKDKLTIDCKIKELEVYENMYIKTVELYYYKNVTVSGDPVNSNKVLPIYENSDTSIQSIRLCIPDTVLTTGLLGTHTYENGIFFVRVTCDGTLGAAISQYPCNADNPVDIGIAVDWQTLYDQGMNHIASMQGCKNVCEPPLGMEQFILTWFSIRLALSACDYEQLGVLWDRFLRTQVCSPGPVSHSNGCGCR